MLKLTIKQEKFCNRYIECGDASEAYRFAYNTENMKPESVHRKAKELIDNVKVSARVKELQDEIKKKSDITKDKVLAEFAKIAFSSIAHLHNTWIERKEFETLTEDQKASIKSISTRVQKIKVGDNEYADVEYVKIELYDKLKALENINKMQGFEAPTKVAQTDKEGNDVNFMTFLMGTNKVATNE